MTYTGKESLKRVGACICITESLCYTAETNTALSVNHTPIFFFILDKISTQEQYNSLLEQTQAKMAAIEDRARQIAEANNISYEALLASNPTYQKLSDP